MTAQFPNLAGMGWSLHRKPTWSTLVSSHVSGREVRAGLYANPIWNFELTFNGLDSSASNPFNTYGGLGAKSLQTLMGFFLSQQGQLGSFYFADPADYSVSSQNIGTGNGSNTSFQLTRTMGAYTEQMFAPFTPAAPGYAPTYPGLTPIYAPNNLVSYSQDLTQSAAWTVAHATIGSSVSDPFGGATAQTITATSSACSVTQAVAASGANYICSVYMRRRTGSGTVTLTNPAGVAQTVALTSAWQLFSFSGAPSGGNATFTVALSTNGDAIDICDCHLEQTYSSTTTPGTYFQTLQTPYYGGPWITVAGALVDPSLYTITTGLVAFTNAPANGAAVAWTGMFSFLCRFDDDSEDFEQFMLNLWEVKTIKLRSLRLS